MNDKLKQYCDSLQEEVKSTEASLSRVGQHLVSPELTPLVDWKASLQATTAECTAKREQAQQAARRVEAWLEEAEKMTGAPLDESNLDREAMNAETLADREERLALDAMRVAAYAILQAEVAVVRAFKTRKTAFDLERFRNTF